MTNLCLAIADKIQDTLIDLLGYESLDFISELLTNRDTIVQNIMSQVRRFLSVPVAQTFVDTLFVHRRIMEKAIIQISYRKKCGERHQVPVLQCNRQVRFRRWSVFVKSRKKPSNIRKAIEMKTKCLPIFWDLKLRIGKQLEKKLFQVHRNVPCSLPHTK